MQYTQALEAQLLELSETAKALSENTKQLEGLALSDATEISVMNARLFAIYNQ